ncbi:MAG TPA: VWA domain-containing protein [Candidatus Acidoferrales bacterium]|nr:VWA domain-containing protein [Candidatus Acidoferrales bacterium]
MRLRRITRGPFGATAATMAAILAIALAGEFLARGQSVSTDEVRWSVRNFFPAAPGAIRVQTDLVQADVVVRDGRGNLVGGLGATDFKVFDNGKEQKLSLFSVETAPKQTVVEHAAPGSDAPAEVASETPITKPIAKPRYIALLMDDTSMPNSDVVNSRRAAEQFVRESMLPGDKAGVFTTSTQVTQMFTEDKAALLAALGKVVNRQKRPGRLGTCPAMTDYEAYMLRSFAGEHTPELDLAMILQAGCCPLSGGRSGKSEQVTCLNNMANETLALAEHFGQDTLGIIGDVIRVLSHQDGKRVIVLASSGFWSQTLPQQRETITEEALHASVVINSLDAKGLDLDSMGQRPEDGPPIALTGPMLMLAITMETQERNMLNDPMAQLADATGGRFFHNNNDLGRGLREMAAVPEVSYVLGFSPTGIKPDGKFHELKVKVQGHGDYALTARKGYFAPSNEGNVIATAPERRSELEREVMADDVKKAMPVDLNAAVAGVAEGVSSLRVDLQVGVQGLPFEQRNDRKAERLILVTALFDSKNNFLSGAEGILDLSLKDDTWKQLRSTGVSAHLTLTAPQGKYRLREVVQEEGKGMMSAFSRGVEIR